MCIVLKENKERNLMKLKMFEKNFCFFSSHDHKLELVFLGCSLKHLKKVTIFVYGEQDSCLCFVRLML